MHNREQKVKELMESFHTIRRSMAFHHDRNAKMPQITPSQLGVLMMIEKNGESTVKDIAKALAISSSAATQLVDGLVESNYVLRAEDLKDRRKIILKLSKKTASQIMKMKSHGIKRFLELFEILNDTEFDQYIALNKKIVEGISKETKYGH